MASDKTMLIVHCLTAIIFNILYLNNHYLIYYLCDFISFVLRNLEFNEISKEESLFAFYIAFNMAYSTELCIKIIKIYF